MRGTEAEGGQRPQVGRKADGVFVRSLDKRRVGSCLEIKGAQGGRGGDCGNKLSGVVVLRERQTRAASASIFHP